MAIANILETLMIVFFGVAWPLNLYRAIRSHTAKDKSILFDYFALSGYLCGVASKILFENFNLAFYFYFPNIIMVATDIIIYYRNRKLDLVSDRN